MVDSFLVPQMNFLCHLKNSIPTVKFTFSYWFKKLSKCPYDIAYRIPIIKQRKYQKLGYFTSSLKAVFQVGESSKIFLTSRNSKIFFLWKYLQYLLYVNEGYYLKKKTQNKIRKHYIKAISNCYLLCLNYDDNLTK